MSVFFKTNTVPEQLVDFLLSPIRWQLIEVALELSIFDTLSETHSSQDVANILSLQYEQTELLLNALCGLNIIFKVDGYYTIREEIAPYLLSESQCSMRDMLLHLSKIRHANKDIIIDIIKTGSSQHISSDIKNKDFWHNAVKSLYSSQSSIHNDIVLAYLTDLPIWEQAISLLDLGAGSEALAQAISEKHPGLQITLFDLPASAEKIKQRLGKSSAVNVIGGDFNNDEWGGQYDIIWASMSLYYVVDMDAFLEKIKKCLNINGVFLSFHEDLCRSRTLPEAHVTGRFLPAISGNDLSFSDGFIAKKLKQVGFKYVESQTVKSPFGEMRLDIAYR